MHMKKQAQQEADHFEVPVLEYARMTTALKTALHKRHEKKITYMTAAHDLEAKKAHHSKVLGMGGDRQVHTRMSGGYCRSKQAVELSGYFVYGLKTKSHAGTQSPSVPYFRLILLPFVLASTLGSGDSGTRCSHRS